MYNLGCQEWVKNITDYQFWLSLFSGKLCIKTHFLSLEKEHVALLKEDYEPIVWAYS